MSARATVVIRSAFTLGHKLCIKWCMPSIRPYPRTESRPNNGFPDEVELWKASARARILRKSSNVYLKSMNPVRRRRMRAIIWTVVGFIALAAGALLPRSPQLVVVLLLVALLATRAAGETTKETIDVRSGVERQSNAASAALAAGRHREAGALAREALERARSHEQRIRLWTTLAWAAIAEPDPLLARVALRRLPLQELDVHLLASYLACSNRPEEAVELLLEARGLGHRTRETSKLLIDLLFSQGDLAQVQAIAHSDADVLSEGERQAIASASRCR